MDLSLFLEGFANSLTFTNLGFGLLGTILGTLVGVLPGIGPALAISLLLPVTLLVDPTAALIMFGAIYYGTMFGGSTTSILLNAPGESGSMMTTIEGNKMARNGRASAALATSAIGSFIAGAVATGIVAIAAPSIAWIGIRMTPADFFAMMVLAFATVGAILGQSMVRGLIALFFGLSIGLVGLDLQSGAERLTFGIPDAYDGIETVVLVVSLFALGEALYVALFGQLSKADKSAFKGMAWMTKEDFRRSWGPWIRGTAIGFPTGVIPAGGSELPTFLSYALEKRLAKKKHNEFGKGAIEGVAGPEAANNANAAGAMVPLLALGLPTSATAAVMLVAFQQFDIQPGPLLFNDHPLLVWTLISALLIGNALLLVINLPLVGLWAKLLTIPVPFLYGGIVTFAMVGALVLNNNVFDLWAAIVIGIIGLLFRKFGYPITPLILGVILGPMAEQQFRRALQGAAGDPGILLSTPFTIAVYVLLVLVLIGPPIYRKLFARQGAK